MMKGWAKKGSVIAVIGVATFAALGFRWLNQPVVSKGAPQVQSAQTALPTNLRLNAESFETQVDNMRLRNVNQQTAPALSRLLAGSTRPIDGDQLAITVSNLPREGFREVSDVNLRLMTGSGYEVAQLEGLPADALVFRSPERYELSVFWPHDGIYAAIVLTGRPDRITQINQHAQTIIDNWQWR